MEILSKGQEMTRRHNIWLRKTTFRIFFNVTVLLSILWQAGCINMVSNVAGVSIYILLTFVYELLFSECPTAKNRPRYIACLICTGLFLICGLYFITSAEAFSTFSKVQHSIKP